MTPATEAIRTVGDVSFPEFADRLSGPGLGVRIGPFAAHVTAKVRGLTEPLYRLYRDYPLLGSAEIYSFHMALRELRRGPFGARVRFVVDGLVPHEDLPAEQALAVLEWGLNLVIALRMHVFLMLHAAAVERNGGLLLLPGAPGDGKTTLCAGLVHRGWRLFSDEFGIVRPRTTDFLPLPRPMPLKNESIGVIRSFAPEAELGPQIPNTRKGTIAHVKAPAESIAKAAIPARPRWIVLPRWSPTRPFALEPMPKAEAFTALAINAFNFELPGEAAFLTVRDTIDGAQCFRLTYSHLDDAVAALTQLADEAAPSDAA